jgi:LmbE family N-acetylglucosaminyl deacetylase
MWIYLSPHLDDAIFSCGGIIAAQVEKNEEVEVWTLCSGKPPIRPLSKFAAHLHTLYGYGSDPIGGRIAEDTKACSLLGINYRHFSFLDAIYRKKRDGKRFLYPTPTSMFGKPLLEDRLFLENILHELCKHINTSCRLVVPFGIGQHVDHLLIRLAAEKTGYNLWYYEDFPYVAKVQFEKKWLEMAGLQEERIPVEKKHVQIWEKVVATYNSQVPIIWRSRQNMSKMLWRYYADGGGKSVWQKN